ncbi:TBC1 domain family member 23-like isoform X1 [Argiope bruennichi]|uniref:TBC1 domain family member 23 n=1 Tax=Argiope bruennichi TaxID=94029 RepID=A0A8T0EJS7_ARGBR|nr:TBC1 domain family member 23-like isoform X1 [Argiope bruennichi]KAF8774170.1 TBC1 domain family member 23 like protein [Argiope bruennichi]
MASPEEEYDTSWVSDLKQVLLSECKIDSIRKVCRGKPVPDTLRAEIWQICLNINPKNEESWDEIFDLPEQPVIRKDCQSLVDRLGNEEEDKVSVLCDIESVITRYRRQSGYDYDSNWVHLLEPLIALRLPKTKLYSYFCSIHTRFLPKNCAKESSPFHLLRLLLLYHEPELCSFLDTKKITPEAYAESWFGSLFSSVCCLKVIQNMWDIYFQAGDPFLVFYLALVIVINAKEQLLEMRDADKQSIIEELSTMPCRLEAEDVEDFCTVAFHYISCTPPSYTKECQSIIFEGKSPADDGALLSQALCLPVSVHDLISRNNTKGDKNIKYFVVDCRPANQYNSGHLSTAFHLDASLMLREPAAFGTAVEALFAAKKQANVVGSVAAGEHICFMGSGREEEDLYVHMVVASFLQKHQHYVSLAQGGYEALHKIIPSSDINVALASHCVKNCLVCVSQNQNTVNGETHEKEVSIFDQLATVVKSRSNIVKERLVEYITNPQTEEARHVSSNDRLGKRYRGMAPVFSIGDDEDPDRYTESDEDSSFEEVNIQTWLKKPGVIGTFVCEEIRDIQLRYPGHLIVTETHLYILRTNRQKKGYAHIVAAHPLTSIVKITSKRKCPEWITFAYGHIEDDGIVVQSRDHLFIPKAGDATSLIKYRIYAMGEQSSER